MVSVKRTVADLKVFGRGYVRSREGLFFALVFPIILIVLFGAIFSGNGGPATVYVQNKDNGSPASVALITALNSTNVMTLVSVSPSQNLSQYLLAHSNPDGIIIPAGFQQDILNGSANITVYVNPTSTTSDTVSGFTQGVVNDYNLQFAKAKAAVTVQSLNIKSSSFKYIDFLVPGLIGFAILTSPMFALVNISAQYKRDKLFKQLSLTPLTKSEWLLSKIIWYVLLTVVSFVLMTTVGIALFGAEITYSFWLIPFLLLGPIMFVSLGMLVGSVSTSVESAAVVGNLVTFPMMFLSGTFFPVNSMPVWLQGVAHVLPLFYVIDGLNNVMVYGNISAALVDMAVLLVVVAVFFAAAVTFFKWRED
jgi:ABC-2 type transport system permease protein